MKGHQSVSVRQDKSEKIAIKNKERGAYQAIVVLCLDSYPRFRPGRLTASSLLW